MAWSLDSKLLPFLETFREHEKHCMAQFLHTNASFVRTMYTVYRMKTCQQLTALQLSDFVRSTKTSPKLVQNAGPRERLYDSLFEIRLPARSILVDCDRKAFHLKTIYEPCWSLSAIAPAASQACNWRSLSQPFDERVAFRWSCNFVCVSFRPKVSSATPSTLHFLVASSGSGLKCRQLMKSKSQRRSSNQVNSSKWVCWVKLGFDKCLDALSPGSLKLSGLSADYYAHRQHSIRLAQAFKHPNLVSYQRVVYPARLAEFFNIHNIHNILTEIFYRWLYRIDH